MTDADVEDRTRSTRRYRQAFFSSAALAVARGCSLLSMLLLVPVLLQHLDQSRFGLWMAFTSVVSSMAFADLGLGHGLMTAMAIASARSDRTHSRRIVSSGMAAMIGVAVPVTALVIIVGLLAPWNRWLGADALPLGELRMAVMILMLGMVAGGIAGAAGRVQSGMQKGYFASLWTAATAVASLVAIVAATRADVSLPGLVAIFVGMPILTGALNSLWYFGSYAADLRPSIRLVDANEMRNLFRLGLMFFVLQVAAALTFATDNLMLAAVLGPESVAGYAVPARLFSCISLCVAILVQPLWPAYAEASARGDMTWVRRTFKRSLAFALALSVTAGGTLYLLRDLIFPLWTQSTLPIDARVVAMLAIWSIFDSCSIALAMLLNGLNIVRIQVVTAVILTIVSFPVRYLLLQKFGAWGLPLATSLVYVVVAIVPYTLLVPRLMRERERRFRPADSVG